MTATSGHAELAYDVIDGGNGRGPAVLLLHAGVADRRSWGPVVEALGPRHATVAFDRRGFGETRYRPEPNSHVDDALAVLDAAGAGSVPAAAVGASMGGRTALDLALAHPQRVAALVLIGSAVRGAPRTDDADLPEAERRLAEAIEAAEAACPTPASRSSRVRPTCPTSRASLIAWQPSPPSSRRSELPSTVTRSRGAAELVDSGRVDVEGC